MQASHLRIWLKLLEKLKTICKTEFTVEIFKINPPQRSSAAEPILLTGTNEYYAFPFYLIQIEKAVTHSTL